MDACYGMARDDGDDQALGGDDHGNEMSHFQRRQRRRRED
jgi:hypothetical protein